MSDGNLPARSTGQLDLMRRLKIRDVQHAQHTLPFLEEDERVKLTRILNTAIEHGITPKVERQAYDFLVSIGLRDEMFRFLTDDERSELANLTRNIATTNETSKSKKRPHSNMSTGELIAITSVISAITAAAFLTYNDPDTINSAFWVAVWGVISGGGFITATRRRDVTVEGPASTREGLLVALVWCAAATATAALGGEVMPAGWAAFLSFIGAGTIGRAILKLRMRN